jgi:uncharacterized protein (TIGR02145 family)
MLKFCVLFILPALLFLGCGGYEDKYIFKNGRFICHDEQYDSSTQYCDDGLVKDKEIFTDERDNKIYRYIKIGEQIWMAENLNYENPNTKCYNDDPYNCTIFGRMYDFETAKTICPAGWHLPNDDDFLTLRDFVEKINDCTSCAGIALKANSSIWTSHKGTDEFGFTALPGGFYRNGDFTQKNETAGFWSATEGNMQGSAHFRYFTNSFAGSKSSLNNSLNLAGFYIDNAFANVRCIKD